MLLPDQRDGTLYASLTLGHFGCETCECTCKHADS